jgi:glycosyltransferase involved in cell wall biosynthesis
MRVLISTWVFPTHGGIFSFLSLVVPNLVSKGHLIDIVAIAPSPAARRDFTHLPGNRIHNLAQLPLPSPLSFPLPQFIMKLVTLARRLEPDLIFCQDPFYSGIPSCLAAIIAGVPLGLADHGMITNFAREDYWRNFGFRAVGLWKLACLLAMKLVIRKSSFIYSPGGDVTERVSELFGEEATRKTSTLPIPIDTESLRPRIEARRRMRSELGLGDRIIAIFVGRLHVESGLDFLIEASRILSTEERPRFLIVGDGALRERYEARAGELAPECFTFLGYREDVADLLNAADLFVFPKVFAGGHSVALREAMATGLASIATAGVDSHDEIISSGETGILVPPGDPSSLASAIRLMVCDEKARRRMGDLARKSVERDYGVGPFLEALEDLLQCVNVA